VTRDPRARRLGERRAPRRLHGYRFDESVVLMRRLTPWSVRTQRQRRGVARSRRALKALRAYESAFFESLVAHAESVARDLTRDLELSGEAFVKVGWEDALGGTHYERIDPSDVQSSVGTGQRFKYAGFSGPHPTLVEPCPACGAPEMHYCNERGQPIDAPHEARRLAAGTIE
jgi:hypothetical protein